MVGSAWCKQQSSIKYVVVYVERIIVVNGGRDVVFT